MQQFMKQKEVPLPPEFEGNIFVSMVVRALIVNRLFTIIVLQLFVVGCIGI